MVHVSRTNVLLVLTLQVSAVLLVSIITAPLVLYVVPRLQTVQPATQLVVSLVCWGSSRAAQLLDISMEFLVSTAQTTVELAMVQDVLLAKIPTLVAVQADAISIQTLVLAIIAVNLIVSDVQVVYLGILCAVLVVDISVEVTVLTVTPVVMAVIAQDALLALVPTLLAVLRIKYIMAPPVKHAQVIVQLAILTDVFPVQLEYLIAAQQDDIITALPALHATQQIVLPVTVLVVSLVLQGRPVALYSGTTTVVLVLVRTALLLMIEAVPNVPLGLIVVLLFDILTTAIV